MLPSTCLRAAVARAGSTQAHTARCVPLTSCWARLRAAEIKGELKKKDDEFVRTLKKQAEDIDTLLQYMSRQFVEMQNAYKDELDEIENAFLAVRGLPHEGRMQLLAVQPGCIGGEAMGTVGA